MTAVACTAPGVHLEAFERWLRSWGAADRTIDERLIAVNAGLREWGDPAACTAEILSDWLASPRFGPWTKVAYYNHLRSYFGWLHTTGRIVTNPADALRVPRSPKDQPRPLTPDEVIRVLEATTGHLKAWLMLDLLAGLRAHEIAKIAGEDVTESGIFVLGKGRRMATIPTHPQLWELAQYYPRRGWWFPSRYKRSTTGHMESRSISTMVAKHFTGSASRGRSTGPDTPTPPNYSAPARTCVSSKNSCDTTTSPPPPATQPSTKASGSQQSAP